MKEYDAYLFDRDGTAAQTPLKMKASQAVGIDSVLFYPPERDFYDLGELRAHGSTYIINSWQELLDQLQ